jgi:hypothetical protein
MRRAPRTNVRKAKDACAERQFVRTILLCYIYPSDGSATPWLSGEGLKGSRRGLIGALFPHFSEGPRKTTLKLKYDGRYPRKIPAYYLLNTHEEPFL